MLFDNAKAFFFQTNRLQKSVLLSVFLFTIVTHMLTPFWVIILTNHLDQSLYVAGLVVSLKGVSNRVFSLYGGWLGDRISAFHLILIALLMRAVALFVLFYDINLYTVVLCSQIIGITSGMFHPVVRKALYASVNERIGLETLITLRLIGFNAAVAIAPVLGAYFLLDFSAVGASILAAILIALVLMMIAIRSQFESVNTANSVPSMERLIGTYHSIKSIFPFAFLFMVLYSTLLFTFTDYVEGTVNSQFLALCFSVNAIVVIVLQGAASKIPEHRILPLIYLFFSGYFVLLSLSSISTNMVLIYGLVLMSTISVSLSEILYSFRFEYMLTKLSGGSALAFGAANCIMFLPALIANLVGSFVVTKFDYVTWWAALTAISVGLSLYFIQKSISPNTRKVNFER
ncbi:MAG: hypothetical protein CENE_01843 [Candidatus Celerinatantimonas neptuna]|nr:MAG: hypothetical protein CENE_01843 [Candidatus Celerinatantimonas neptuna]